MARKDVKFKCRCSRERSFDLIAGLGKDEIEKTLAEQGEIEVRCHFCNNTYTFEKEEVTELIEKSEAKEKKISEVDTDEIIVEGKDD